MEHSILPQEASHIAHRWKVSQLSDLDSITVIESDLDKLALVCGIYYRLSKISPKVWSKVQTTKTSELTNDSDFATNGDIALNYEPKNSNIQEHISDNTKHFTQSEISITESQISDLKSYALSSDTYTKNQTDTQISNAISAVVDSSPATLDTLNELAAALGDDPNFATTLTNAIGNRIQKVTLTDNAIVRADGTGGDVQSSGVTIDDDNNISVPGNAYLNLGSNHDGGAKLLYNENGNLDITPRSGYNTVFTGGNVVHNNYTKLGSDAPAIKMKKITGKTVDIEGGVFTVAHGLTGSKILDISVRVYFATYTSVPPEYTNAGGYQFSTYSDGARVYIINSATNSENILNKPFTVLITYEE